MKFAVDSVTFFLFCHFVLYCFVLFCFLCFALYWRMNPGNFAKLPRMDRNLGSFCLSFPEFVGFRHVPPCLISITVFTVNYQASPLSRDCTPSPRG